MVSRAPSEQCRFALGLILVEIVISGIAVINENAAMSGRPPHETCTQGSSIVDGKERRTWVHLKRSVT
jgi:hypothetical protein